jgi:two-component system nitrogen regulation sensor histidine kinase GlnL
LRAVLSFVEHRIGERLEGRDAQLFARSSPVRIGGRAPRQLDLMIAPVAAHPGWQMLTLHESFGIEGLSGDGAGAGGGDGAPVRAPDVLAHEIKNPLAGIRGAAQLLARSANSSQRALTDLITAEVDRITRLIDQMQTLGRRQTAPAVPCNVHQALRRALAVLDAGDTRGPPVEEEFDPSLPPVLCSDGALVQVLLNLLTNAREACSGEPRPRIVVRTRFASGIRLDCRAGHGPLSLPLEVRISDNGPGVDPAVRDHIFEPFVTGKPRGQGLGLALVQKLVGDMNGRITHDRDEQARLTHFRLHLPVAESRRAARTAVAA